jgi:glutathione S-transferase
MILIGQYDSPFVRRVGIALRLYGVPFEHRPWSTFADAAKVRTHNPLGRVPTLVLEEGEALTESHAILDYLDSQVPAERAMFPQREPQRRRALAVAALATGLADKAVSLFYERRLHEKVSEVWVARCREQITGTLAVLEAGRAAAKSTWWQGESLGHADVAVASALRFLGEAHPDLWNVARHPALAAHSARAEALPVFREISQPFVPPV